MTWQNALQRWAKCVSAFILIGGILVFMFAGETLNDHLRGNLRGDELLLLASATRDQRGVRCALDQGANIEARSPVGATPLIFACGGGDAEIVRILLDRGANVANEAPHGLTPMHAAIINGNPRVVEMLLESGANPNGISCGVTPLDLAEEYDYIEIVAAIRAHGGKHLTELRADQTE